MDDGAGSRGNKIRTGLESCSARGLKSGRAVSIFALLHDIYDVNNCNILYIAMYIYEKSP